MTFVFLALHFVHSHSAGLSASCDTPFRVAARPLSTILCTFIELYGQ